MTYLLTAIATAVAIVALAEANDSMMCFAGVLLVFSRVVEVERRIGRLERER